MVGVDLGTRIVKVNVSKIRKDMNPIEDVDVPLDPTAMQASAEIPANQFSHANAGMTASEVSRVTVASDKDPALKLQADDGRQVGPEGQIYANAVWAPVTHGKIDFLELFAGSAWPPNRI